MTTSPRFKIPPNRLHQLWSKTSHLVSPCNHGGVNKPTLISSLAHYFDEKRKILEDYFYADNCNRNHAYIQHLRVFKLILSRDKTHIRDIVAELGFSRRKVLYITKTLMELGLIQCKLGRGGYYYVDDRNYEPTPFNNAPSKGATVSNPVPPTPPYNVNNRCVNNNSSTCTSVRTNFTTKRKEKKNFFLILLSNPNSIWAFKHKLEMEYLDNQPKYYIIKALPTQGIAYSHDFLEFICRKFSLSHNKASSHLERFCDWLFHKRDDEPMHVHLNLRCFQNIVPLFISFLRKDMAKLREFQELLECRRAEREKARELAEREYETRTPVRKRCDSGRPMSIGDILTNLLAGSGL